MTAATPQPRRLPSQVPFIIGNEGCERFSFYGMRNVLTVFLVSYLLTELPQGQRELAAKDVFHTFVIGVYFFPLLGGFIADRLLGKYRTILWLSIVYCLGHLCLALFENSRTGFYLGLGLIAIGSGGIKPCVSAFVGDQFDESNKQLARIVFDAFYWIINFGSFFASLLIPLTLKVYGPSVAFGIPGILMAMATFILWLGRKKYVHVLPSRNEDPHSFVKVCVSALASPRGRVFKGLAALGFLGATALIPWLGFVAGASLGLVVVLTVLGFAVSRELGNAQDVHPESAVDAVRCVLRLLIVFALVTPFWSLFDQKASTWVLQANAMSKPNWFQASQMQAVNPALVMLLIPLNNAALYPFLRRRGIEPTPLRRMTTGIALSGLAWVVVGTFQLFLDGGTTFSIVWQLLPYALLTMGEVLVSATGLEFAYSQAPPQMKSTLMSFWSLSVTVGNLWVLLVNASVKNDQLTQFVGATGLGVTAFQMFFFAGFAFVAAALFGANARRYQVKDHYRSAELKPA